MASFEIIGPADDATYFAGLMMRSNLKICQWMLAICVSVLLSAAVHAQTNKSAHRKLERPTGGSSDVQGQIELIKRLQALMQNRSADSTDEPEGLSSLQKTMMESVLKQFQNSDSLPDLSALPPDLLGKMMADPQARQDAKEMLERFQKDRKLPEATGSGGLPLPPSDNAPGAANAPNSANAPNDGRSSDNRRPQGEQQDLPNERRSSSDSDARNTGRPNSASNNRPSNNNFPPNRSSSDADSTDRGNQRKLNGPNNDSESFGDEFDNNRQRSSEDTNPPVRMPGESESEYLDRYSEFVEREIQRQRERGLTEPLDQSELPNQPSPSSVNPNGQRSTQPSDSQQQQQNSDSRGNSDARRNNGEQSDNSSQFPPTISDFLKELGELPQLPSEGSSTNQASPPGSNTSSPTRGSGQQNSGSPSVRAGGEGSSGAETQAGQAASTKDAEQLAQRKQQIKEELQRSGLKSTLQKILRQAREDIKNRPATESSTNGSAANNGAGGGSGLLPEITPNMEKAIIRSLDSLGKEVLEYAKDGKRKTPKPSFESSFSSAPPLVDASQKPGSSDAGDSWTKQASDFFSNVVSPTPEPKPSQPSSASASSSDSSQAMPTVEFSWLPFVILGVIVLLAFGFAKKSGIIGNGAAPKKDVRFVFGAQGSGLRTREDVVKAFHELALKPGHDAESWWTHEQFKQQVKSRVQLEDHPIEVLAEVYEQARYLPDDATLNEQQLEQARAALQRCEP